MVRLKTTIREAFIRNEHLTAIFFDLEKAYYTTWKYEIMRDLLDLGLKGRLPYFINGFLFDRKLKIRIGPTLSDMKNLEEGVPPGSVLSVTLFSIKINNITKCLSPGVDGSLYIDNLLMLQVEISTHHWVQLLTKWTNGQQKMGLDFLKLNVFISVIKENYTMILAWNLKRQKFQL